MKNFIFGFLIAGVIGAVAVGGYFYGKKQTNIIPLPTPTGIASISSTPIVTVTTAVVLSVSPQPTTVNDVELIKQALIKKNNWTNMDIEVTVSKNDGTYATGGVKEKGSEVGGGYFFAKKVNGEWKIVADGNGTINCASLIPYPDYPSSLIPECYDEKTGTTIKR